MQTRPHIFDLDRDRLQEIIVSIGEKNYVADQVLQWVYRHGILDLESMTNISAAAREAISEAIQFKRGTVIEDQLASDGTRKVLVDWDASPGNLPVLQEVGAGTRRTEAVMIPAESRRTACVSSQVGCPVGCTFCASGIGGLDGNLTRGQIVEQIHHLATTEQGRGRSLKDLDINQVPLVGKSLVGYAGVFCPNGDLPRRHIESKLIFLVFS